MGQLARRYSSPEMYRLTAPEMALLDGLYFRSWPRRMDAEIARAKQRRVAWLEQMKKRGEGADEQ